MTNHIVDATPPANRRHVDTDSARLRAHINRLETLALRLHDDAREAEARHAHRRATLENWVATTEARLASIEAENAQLRTTITELHASTSWRLTAPLRWLRLRLP